MTAPNWGSDQACLQSVLYPGGTGQALRARLGWNFSDIGGGTQSAYRIVVERQQGNNEVINTGKCTFSCFSNGTGCVGGATQAKCRINPVANTAGCPNNFCFPLSGYAPFNDPFFSFSAGTIYNYRWTLEVWDNNDMKSTATYSYNSNGGTGDTPLSIDDGANSTFRTYSHEFPRPVFTWFPESPAAGEEVEFSATTSKCFFVANPTNPVECTSATWSWSRVAGYSGIDPDPPASASTTHTSFIDPGLDIGVSLNLVGSNGYACATSTEGDIEVRHYLPDWKEGR
jgi:hypothetical protein